MAPCGQEIKKGAEFNQRTFFAATICSVIQVAPKKKNSTYPKPKQGQLKL